MSEQKGTGTIKASKIVEQYIDPIPDIGWNCGGGELFQQSRLNCSAEMTPTIFNRVRFWAKMRILETPDDDRVYRKLMKQMDEFNEWGERLYRRRFKRPEDYFSSK